jgi:hypothetical protein
MNKRLIIAGFFAVLLLLVPLNAAADSEVKVIPKGTLVVEELIKIELTDEEFQQLNDFVDGIEDPEEQFDAQAILNRVIDESGNLNFGEFGSVLEEQVITDEDEDIIVDEIAVGIILGIEGVRESNPIEDLLNNFMDIILDRLGWAYDLVTKASNLLSDAQALLNDAGLPAQIISDLSNAIHWIGNALELSVLLLVKTRWWQFAQKWAYRIELITSLMEAITSIQSLATNLGILVGDLQRFVLDATDFITWFGEEPWTKPVHIYGEVMNQDGLTLTPIADVDVSCRGVSTITDENGAFDFYVEIDDTSSSLPPNQPYGMHVCEITAEKQGEFTKTTQPAELTYCFSDGGVYWLFLIKDDDDGAKQKTFVNSFVDKISIIFNGIFEKLEVTWLNLILKLKEQNIQFTA